MTVRCPRVVSGASSALAVTLALGVAFLAWTGNASAQPGTSEPRVPEGKCVSESGTLLGSETGGAPWRPVGEVYTRDHLMALPGIKAEIEPAAGGVRLTLWGNLPEQSQHAVLESLAVLHDTRAYDLDLTLLAGRAVLTSTNKSGRAKVWLRLPGEGWEIVLDGEGSSVAIELYGRWPRGVPFVKDPLSPLRPTSLLSLEVLKGHADVRLDGRQVRLSAPPGPSFLRWDSVGGADAGPERREKLPAWADDSASPSDDAKTLQGVAAKYLEAVRSRPPAEVLHSLLVSNDSDRVRATLTREFAVLGLAAVGALPEVVELLGTSRNEDVRLTAILALRNWIGSAPGRDYQLYQVLLGRLAYSEPQAATVLQLLHSPFDPDDPATYQALIAYLQHDRLAIRELARWHLYRLVPQGASIAYDAGGTAEDRVKAARQWKEIIPDGQLPKKPQKEGANEDGKK